MRRTLFFAVFLPILTFLGFTSAGTVGADPTGLAISGQTCGFDGRIDATLTWTPDGAGQQFVDLTGRNDNFSSAYSTGGPYDVSRTEVDLVNLQPGTTYYARVSTLLGSQFLRSDVLAFRTASCVGDGGLDSGNVRLPTHLQAAALSATSARFQWVPERAIASSVSTTQRTPPIC